jgi:hypothetical protein
MRLTNADNRQAGRWRDAAQPGHSGDPLNILAIQKGSMSAAIDEAKRFLEGRGSGPAPIEPVNISIGSAEQVSRAHRLYAMGRPLYGSPAARYLTGRGIGNLRLTEDVLRFTSSCYFVDSTDPDLVRQKIPALLCKITDLAGNLRAVNRIYLDRKSPRLADVGEPKKLLGDMLGNAVRFGPVTEDAIAGEGVETVLSVRCAAPHLHHLAGLTANHLSAMKLDPRIKRLWVAHDNDVEGMNALAVLAGRSLDLGLEVRPISPISKDHNEDLQSFILQYGSDRGYDLFTKRLAGLIRIESFGWA